MTYEQKLLMAMDQSGVTPEEFGERLAMATAPLNLDDTRSQAIRASARSWFLGLIYGYDILEAEDAYKSFDSEAKYVLVNMFGTRTERITIERVQALIPTSAHLLDSIRALRLGEAVDLVPGGQAIRVK